ncbi:MAG: inositol monophosphatase family protein [Anaerolineae bacterium]|nr:inositol monophosphatase family protein [Anaerolineae bacterium]
MIDRHRSLQDFLDFATETAYLAGRLTLGYFNAGVRPDFKGDDSPVTAADRAAEELIRQRIEERYPGHAIVGEEMGATEAVGPALRWFVDPIDGTKAFIRGVPLYGVLLALEIEGQVDVGVAYFPALDEMVYAARGLGCWWNGRRARVSPATSLARAYVTCGDVGGFVAYGRAGAWERLARACYVRAGWGDAYGYALVATGRAEIMLDPVMNVWDCAPFPPILAEAGGYFGDWQGNPTIYAGEAMATTPALLPEVLALIRD